MIIKSEGQISPSSPQAQQTRGGQPRSLRRPHRAEERLESGVELSRLGGREGEADRRLAGVERQLVACGIGVLFFCFCVGGASRLRASVGRGGNSAA